MTGYQEYDLDDPCSLCEEDEATISRGAPVCADCATWLDRLEGELAAMEAADPKLRAAGARLDDLGRRLR